MMQLWIWVSSESKSAGCLNFCSHFQLFERMSDQWQCSFAFELCLLSRSWWAPANWKRLIWLNRQLNSFYTILHHGGSFDSHLLSEQYKKWMPIWSQRTTRATTENVFFFFFHVVMKLVHTQSLRVSIVRWLHGRNYIISAGLLWTNSILDGYRKPRMVIKHCRNKGMTFWATLPEHLWSNNRKIEHGYRWSALSFLLWDMSNNASRWCWLPTSQFLGHLHVKCIYIL